MCYIAILSVSVTKYKTLTMSKPSFRKYNRSITTIAIIIGLILIAWFLARSVFFNQAANHDSPKAAAAYYQIKQLSEQPNQTKAIVQNSQNLIDHYPHTPYATFSSWLATKQLLQDNHPKQAIALLKKNLTTQPNNSLNSITRLRLAQIYLGQHQPDDAIEQLNQLDSHFAVSRAYFLGQAYQQKGEYEKAQQQWKDALEQTENQPDLMPVTHMIKLQMSESINQQAQDKQSDANNTVPESHH